MTRLSLRAIKDQIKGGLADNKSPKDIAKRHDVSIDHIRKQLEMGIKVEREHTDDDAKAMEIAMDHLWESPDYYTYLKEMEKKFEQKKDAKIRKEKGGYRVLSEKGKNLGGPYPSKSKAEKRLKEVEMFKHMKGMRSNTLKILRTAFQSLKQVNKEALKALERKYSAGEPIIPRDLVPVIGVDAAVTLTTTTDLTPKQIAEQLIFFGRNALEIKNEIAWKGFGEKPRVRPVKPSVKPSGETL